MSVVLAYIDPGSGSMIFQAAIAFVAGAAVSVGVFWQRITRRLRRRQPDRHA